MIDSLGDRMKKAEALSEGRLDSRLPIVCRCDGRSFHTFTKGLQRPYDKGLSNLMIETTKYLVEETNAILGYTQSDEISLLFSPANEDSQVFFNAKHSKMVSSLAALTTGFFNGNMPFHLLDKTLDFIEKDGLDGDRVTHFVTFDCRAFNLPNETEVANYFIWREKDAVRNSISMAAQSMYSHKELEGKSSSEKQEMIFQKGVNWNNYPSFFKRGSYLQRVKVEKPFSAEELAKLPEKHQARTNPDLKVVRSEVQLMDWPILTKIGNRVDVIFGRTKPELRV